MKKVFRKSSASGWLSPPSSLSRHNGCPSLLFNKPLVKNILLSQLSKRTGINIRAGTLDYSFSRFASGGALEFGLENDLQKWNISLARLEAKGFLEARPRIKPAFEIVEAEGACSTSPKRRPREARRL